MKKEKVFTIIAVTILSLCLTIQSFGQELPKPGTVINKSNYKQYAHLWPEEALVLFEDGLGGLVKPINITVAEPKPFKLLTKFKALSEKNKDKYGVDKDGNLTGGFDSVGQPFPGVTPVDKDFALKFMWNYAFNYVGDSEELIVYSLLQRKGEVVRATEAEMPRIWFYNRLYENQKPTYQNPQGLAKAILYRIVLPESLKNTMNLEYRYLDLKKGDDTYLYLPAMRRVMRADAGQRSVPMAGLIVTLDDVNLFDGRTAEFTYKLVKEQKILACFDPKMSFDWVKKQKLDLLPVFDDGWEVRDTYVIDITPKSPRYPQSKKRIWIDKETYAPYHTVVWDRAGKFWKYWFMARSRAKTPDGEIFDVEGGMQGWDAQFGMGGVNFMKYKMNTGKLRHEDFTPQALPKVAKQ